MSKPIPFQPATNNVPVIGQPMTIQSVVIPVNVTFRCNCGGHDDLLVAVMSQPVQCPGCGKVYAIACALPQGANLQVQIGVNAEDKVPS